MARRGQISLARVREVQPCETFRADHRLCGSYELSNIRDVLLSNLKLPSGPLHDRNAAIREDESCLITLVVERILSRMRPVNRIPMQRKKRPIGEHSLH